MVVGHQPADRRRGAVGLPAPDVAGRAVWRGEQIATVAMHRRTEPLVSAAAAPGGTPQRPVATTTRAQVRWKERVTPTRKPIRPHADDEPIGSSFPMRRTVTVINTCLGNAFLHAGFTASGRCENRNFVPGDNVFPGALVEPVETLDPFLFPSIRHSSNTPFKVKWYLILGML